MPVGSCRARATSVQSGATHESAPHLEPPVTENQSQHPNSVHLTVSSVLKSLKFYREKLGFRLTESFPSPKKPVWANVLLDDQAVMLGQLPSLAEARQFGMDAAEIELLKRDAKAFARGAAGTGVQIYLQVADVDAFYKRLRRKGVKPLTKAKTQFYGIRDFQVEDPDGYRLVFYTRTEACRVVGGGKGARSEREAVAVG